MKKLLTVWMIFGIAMSGCQGLGLGGLQPKGMTASPTAVVIPAQPQTRITPTQEITRTVSDGQSIITIWVPPQLDPNGVVPGAAIFRSRLDSFRGQNPDLKVQVRVKAQSGPGGILESLAAANTAAPRALPSLVALSRPDLEVAAIKGLILPVDGVTTVMIDADWYDYARQIATVQGNTFGLPFGGDSLLLVYRPSKVGAAPNSWDAIVRRGLPLVFPAADPFALLTLVLYQSAGGSTVDAQGRPALQADVLSVVLKMFADGVQQNVFPYWLSQYQSDSQAWQAYREQRAQMIVTTNSRYQAEMPTDSAVVLLPALKGESQTLASGWLWAVTDPQPDRRMVSIRLGEYLVKGDYLATWTAIAGYLPPRPSSLAGWSNQALKAQFNQLALTSRVRPANDLTTVLGPVLQEAVLTIIKRQSDPVRAAQVAIERLGVPKSR